MPKSHETFRWFLRSCTRLKPGKVRMKSPICFVHSHIYAYGRSKCPLWVLGTGSQEAIWHGFRKWYISFVLATYGPSWCSKRACELPYANRPPPVGATCAISKLRMAALYDCFKGHTGPVRISKPRMQPLSGPIGPCTTVLRAIRGSADLQASYKAPTSHSRAMYDCFKGRIWPVRARTGH